MKLAAENLSTWVDPLCCGHALFAAPDLSRPPPVESNRYRVDYGLAMVLAVVRSRCGRLSQVGEYLLLAPERASNHVKAVAVCADRAKSCPLRT